LIREPLTVGIKARQPFRQALAFGGDVVQYGHGLVSLLMRAR
jgi:hypothetical protein